MIAQTYSFAAGTARILALLSATVAISGIAQTNGTSEAGPHRPACSDTRCRKIKSYLKVHFCGEEPYGKRPSDGCEIIAPKSPGVGAEIIAHFICDWSEAESKIVCRQNGRPPSDIRGIVLSNLRRLGLPPEEAD